jgi:D-psicose/D-tagatose/L-ribulose 3-epimerase
MKYGMNLLLWTGEMNDSMLPVLKALKTLGYDGVEVPIFNTGLDYKKWGKILDDFGLARTAVTIRTPEDNPISSDANTRKKGIEGTMRCLDCCADAGCTTLVGPFHSALGHFSGAGPTTD